MLLGDDLLSRAPENCSDSSETSEVASGESGDESANENGDLFQVEVGEEEEAGSSHANNASEDAKRDMGDNSNGLAESKDMPRQSSVRFSQDVEVPDVEVMMGEELASDHVSDHSSEESEDIEEEEEISFLSPDAPHFPFECREDAVMAAAFHGRDR